MPVQYPIPSWIKPADSAGAYAKGYSLGNQSGAAQAQIAMERARLNQHAQQQAVEVVLKQQQLERQNMVDQQKLEVAKAYNQERTQLAQQALEQKAQVMQEKIKQAAMQQMQMERYRNAVASGKDPAQAALELLPGAPGMGGLLGAAMRSQKEVQEYTPQEYTLPSGRKGYYSKKTGALHFEPTEKTPQVTTADLERTLKLRKDSFGGDTNRMAMVKGKAAAELERRLGMGTTNAPAAPQEAILPWPVPVGEKAPPEKFEKGKAYLHPTKGPVRYKGNSAFDPISPRQSAVETPSETEFADTGAEDATDAEADDSEEA